MNKHYTQIQFGAVPVRVGPLAMHIILADTAMACHVTKQMLMVLVYGSMLHVVGMTVCDSYRCQR